MKVVKEASAWLRDPNVRAVCAILLVLVIPAALTLYTVQVPMPRSDVARNPTPFGYTVSLLIYLVPVLALHRWFSRTFGDRGGLRRLAGRAGTRSQTQAALRALDFRRSAFRMTLVTLIPIGYVLDIVLGHALLKFTNLNATFFGERFLVYSVDFSTAGFSRHIPIEEFVFYTFGFIAIPAGVCLV
jgi:hypothetical protein